MWGIQILSVRQHLLNVSCHYIDGNNRVQTCKKQKTTHVSPTHIKQCDLPQPSN